MKDQFTVLQIENALEASSGVKRRAAKLLGCSSATIINYTKKYPHILSLCNDGRKQNDARHAIRCRGCGKPAGEYEFYGKNAGICKSCHREKRAEYRKLYPEKVKNCKKLSFEKNKEHTLAYYKQWRADNQQQYRENIKRWCQSHPEKIKQYASSKDAQIRGAAISDFTASQWNLLKQAYNHTCVYCGSKKKRLTKDHIIPLSKGGNHTMANIVPCCQSCNSKKSNRTPFEVNMPFQQKMTAIFGQT